MYVYISVVSVLLFSCSAEDFEEEEEDVKKFRDRLPSATLDEQLEYLEEKLEIIQGQYTGYTLKRKEKNLRQQLNAVRRQLRQQRPRNSGTVYIHVHILCKYYMCIIYMCTYMNMYTTNFTCVCVPLHVNLHVHVFPVWCTLYVYTYICVNMYMYM